MDFTDFAFWQTTVGTGVTIESSRVGAISPSTLLVNTVYIAGVPKGVTEEEIFQRLFRNDVPVPDDSQYGFRASWPHEILHSFTLASEAIQWSELKE